MTRLPAWMIGLPNHDGRVLVPVNRRGICTAESVLRLGVGEDRMMHPHAAVEVDEMVLNSVRHDLRPEKENGPRVRTGASSRRGRTR